MEVKRFGGYKGSHVCDYPDNMAPVSEFHRDSDGYQDMCKVCKKFADDARFLRRPRHPVTGQVKNIWKHTKAVELGGVQNTPKWQSLLDKAEEEWGKEVTEWKINGKVVSETKRFKFDDKITYSTQKEQTKRNRDSKVVSYIRSVYGLCSVVGCDYSDYDVAHIHALKHGADDIPENCLALCPNHHRDLDRGRMVLTHPHPGVILFTRENKRELNVYTTGQIILQHEVDPKNIDQCNLELEEWKNASNA